MLTKILIVLKLKLLEWGDEGCSRTLKKDRDGEVTGVMCECEIN